MAEIMKHYSNKSSLDCHFNIGVEFKDAAGNFIDCYQLVMNSTGGSSCNN